MKKLGDNYGRPMVNEIRDKLREYYTFGLDDPARVCRTRVHNALFERLLHMQVWYATLREELLEYV